MEYSDIGIVGIAALIILDKLGILNKLLKRKNNGIEERLKRIECNDLSHMEKTLENISEKLDKVNDNTTKILTIIERE